MIASENLDRLNHLANRFGAFLPDIRLILDYLVRYGYLRINPLSFALDLESTLEKVKDAIKEFRHRAGLAPGEIGVDLLGKMTEPRCGCPDIQRQGIAEARWRKTSLKYFIASYVSGLSQPDQNDLIRLAWGDWMAHAGITLTPVASQQGADIIIATGRGRNQGFDGGGGTLAWAYLPNGADQQLLMRFDLDERWMKDNPQGGILFRNVACHEFGHLLGLEHSRVSTALMAPFYTPAIVQPQANDDIPRIQALYGPATTPPPIPPMPPADEITLTVRMKGKQVLSASAV